MLLALLVALTLDSAPADPADAPETPAAAAEAAPAPAPQGGGLVFPTVLPAPAAPVAPAVRFVWRDHPSLRAGRNLRLDFSVKVQEDWRDPGDDPADFSTWELHRFRAGVDGEVFRKIQFSIEREFSENLLNDPTQKSTKSQWKDVYVELNAADAFQARAGKFKIPYGLDQTSGETNLDFIYRSLGGDYLSPGRDIGGGVHGRFFHRGLNYWAGVFQHDGDNSRSSRNVGTDEEIVVGEGGTTVAGRVTAAVFRRFGPAVLKGAEVGGSFETAHVDDKGFLPNGLRGRTVVSQFTFWERMFVKGPRNRYGADIDVNHGPFGARAEWMFVTEARQDQGLGNQTLPILLENAWYVQGSWVVTGEPKTRPLEPRKGGVGLGGYGALELTARYDTLRFSSKKGQDPPFRNTRAETVFPNSDSVFTGGFTYRANRFVKIQGNAIHESISDPERAPTPADSTTPLTKFWSTVVRFQFEI